MDAWYRIHWTFRWQGGPFDAVGTVDGRIKGVYTGCSWGFADNWQLTDETALSGYTRYTVQASLKGVTDLEQHRTDLLAKQQPRSRGPSRCRSTCSSVIRHGSGTYSSYSTSTEAVPGVW
ncbi:hypothetical protein [Streptomyces roseoverticillatus]|uniref:hypothetical protein n=1 Tax=Streptomyces roseoverticillatus TaxID=66429 RepID=UPI0004C09776